MYLKTPVENAGNGNFWAPKFEIFLGGTCPHTPLVSSTIGGLPHYRKLTMHFINMILKKLHKYNAS